MITASRIDRRALRRALDRAAATYDNAAVLQSRLQERLLARLEFVTIEPTMVLDVGCRTGRAARALQERYPRSVVMAVDSSPGMLRLAGGGAVKRVCAETARLPLPDASVDLLFSNLALPCCEDLDAALREFRRVIRPGGLVHFTTLGPDTLSELRSAWQAADDGPHVGEFADMHDVGDGLVRAGLADPVLDVERYTLTYRDGRALMRDLQAVGARNVASGRARGLTGRGRLAAVLSAYERLRRDGLLPASCEVVFGQAWGPAGEPRRLRRRGEFTVDASDIGRRGAP